MDKKIKLFSSQTCSRCRNVKKQIKYLGAEDLFDYIDIDTDRGETLVETYNITAIPTLIYGDTRIETVVLPKALKELIQKAGEQNG